MANGDLQLTSAEAKNRLDGLVYEERSCHIAGIGDVVRSAFGQEAEANLVGRLRDAGALTISMVLVVGDELVAHASASPMSWVSGTDHIMVEALAPVSVKPDRQRRGYGSRIVRATIDRCRENDTDILTVLGNPNYYGRFGFTAASQHGLRIENADFGNAFMVMELKEGKLPEAKGSLRWHPAFDQLGDG